MSEVAATPSAVMPPLRPVGRVTRDPTSQIHQVVLDTVVPNLVEHGLFTGKLAMRFAECFFFASGKLLEVAKVTCKWDLFTDACDAGCPWMIKLLATVFDIPQTTSKLDRRLAFLLACDSGSLAAVKVLHELFALGSDKYLCDWIIADAQTAACQAGDADTYYWLRNNQRPEYVPTDVDLENIIQAACASRSMRILDDALTRRSSLGRRGVEFLAKYTDLRNTVEAACASGSVRILASVSTCRWSLEYHDAEFLAKYSAIPPMHFGFPLMSLCSHGPLEVLRAVWDQHIREWCVNRDYLEAPPFCDRIFGVPGTIRAWCLAAAAGHGQWDTVEWLCKEPDIASSVRYSGLADACTVPAPQLRALKIAYYRGDFNCFEQIYNKLFPNEALADTRQGQWTVLTKFFLDHDVFFHPTFANFLLDRALIIGNKSPALELMYQVYVSIVTTETLPLPPSDYGCMAHIAASVANENRWEITWAFFDALDGLSRDGRVERIEEVIARHRLEIGTFATFDQRRKRFYFLAGCKVCVLDDWASLLNITRDEVKRELPQLVHAFCQRGVRTNFANVLWLITRFTLSIADLKSSFRAMSNSMLSPPAGCWGVLENHFHVDLRARGYYEEDNGGDAF